MGKHFSPPAKFLLSLFVVTLLAGFGAPANAQEKIYRVQFKLSLTDADENFSWYVVRISRISWATESICKDRAKPFINEQIAAVKAFGLINKNNKPPIVKVTSWRCFN